MKYITYIVENEKFCAESNLLINDFGLIFIWQGFQQFMFGTLKSMQLGDFDKVFCVCLFKYLRICCPLNSKSSVI